MSSKSIRICVHVPCILTAATIQGQVFNALTASNCAATVWGVTFIQKNMLTISTGDCYIHLALS